MAVIDISNSFNDCCDSVLSLSSKSINHCLAKGKVGFKDMKALKMGRLYECALCLMLSFSVIMATSTKEKADETTTSTSFLNNQIARGIKNADETVATSASDECFEKAETMLSRLAAFFSLFTLE